MKKSNPVSLVRRSRLAALLVTTIAAAIYYAIFLGFASFIEPQALWSAWAHVAFVWAPLAIMAIFYAWVIKPMAIARSTRILTTLGASVVATLSGALLLNLLWFHHLPVIK